VLASARDPLLTLAQSLWWGVAKPIDIVPSQTSWADEFASLKLSALRAAPLNAYVHHIGSTAVPGLAAKDVIDLQITVDKLSAINASAFMKEGFEPVSGLVDHSPPGLDLSYADLDKRFFRSLARPANIHVRERGRFNQRFALLCRDYLRHHPTTAGAYQLIKQRLANRFPTDHTAYYEIKDPVFDIIVDGAEEWAKVISWSEPPPD
jgi:GrpB-like predicted nucleotidyltransferase (UPF0157 family)